jgi:hypothetical protein
MGRLDCQATHMKWKHLRRKKKTDNPNKNFHSGINWTAEWQWPMNHWLKNTAVKNTIFLIHI